MNEEFLTGIVKQKKAGKSRMDSEMVWQFRIELRSCYFYGYTLFAKSTMTTVLKNYYIRKILKKYMGSGIVYLNCIANFPSMIGTAVLSFVLTLPVNLPLAIPVACIYVSMVNETERRPELKISDNVVLS